MPNCGSQCWLCDLPVRFDTYKGCSHGCSYCFVQRDYDLCEIIPFEAPAALRAFIDGNRSKETSWCDWNIPIHWGGMSDPFQPCEKQHRQSLDALKVLAETGYPAVISTKGQLCIEEPYLSLIRAGNIVMQVSALCAKYDQIEKGAPPFEKRLEMIKVLSQNCKRVIVRAQPYVHDIYKDMLESVKRFADSGAHGVIFEGMKFAKKKKGLVKCGADFVQPKEILRADFFNLRDACHENGLKFYSGENRLRAMGDSLTCCGIDGLEGFKPNKCNINHIINGDFERPTKAQVTGGTAEAIVGIYQTSIMRKFFRHKSFYEGIKFLLIDRKKYVQDMMIG